MPLYVVHRRTNNTRKGCSRHCKVTSTSAEIPHPSGEWITVYLTFIVDHGIAITCERVTVLGRLANIFLEKKKTKVGKTDMGRTGQTYTTQRKESPTLALREPHGSLQAGLEKMCVLVCVVRHAARKVLILLIVRLSNITCHRRVCNVETISMCDVFFQCPSAVHACSAAVLRSPRCTIPRSRRQAASNVGRLVPYEESPGTAWESVDT